MSRTYARKTGATPKATVDAHVDERIVAKIAGKQNKDASLTGLSGLDASPGLVTELSRTSFTKRSIAAGSSAVSVTNADGVLGNPTVDVVPANFTGIPQAAVENLPAVLTSKVATSGNQTVAGTKNFTASPRIPTYTPASSTTAGNPGTLGWDGSYVYVCVATNVWKRSPLTTW